MKGFASWQDHFYSLDAPLKFAGATSAQEDTADDPTGDPGRPDLCFVVTVPPGRRDPAPVHVQRPQVAAYS